MSVTWKDITSYSQSDKERVPRTWEAKVGSLRLVVTRKWMGIQYAKETEGWSGWHIECPLFATVTPKQDDIDKVKAMAVEHVRFGVKRVLEDLEAA